MAAQNEPDMENEFNEISSIWPSGPHRKFSREGDINLIPEPIIENQSMEKENLENCKNLQSINEIEQFQNQEQFFQNKIAAEEHAQFLNPGITV